MRFFGIFDFQEFLVILFKNHHFPKKFFSGVFIIACDSSGTRKDSNKTRKTRERGRITPASLYDVKPILYRLSYSAL